MNITAGQDVVIRATLADQDAVAIDLTGATRIVWGCGRSYGVAPDIAKDDAALGGVTVNDAVNGIIDVALGPLDTTGKQGDYVHQAQVVDSAGQVRDAQLGALVFVENMLESI